jgi:hypothetical protein
MQALMGFVVGVTVVFGVVVGPVLGACIPENIEIDLGMHGNGTTKIANPPTWTCKAQ